MLVLNNESTDGTAEYLNAFKDVWQIYSSPPRSVAASWNMALELVFNAAASDYALVVNNDVELRPDTYRLLVEDGGGFVTAVGVRELSNTLSVPNPNAKRPHPDFSCFLIRREVYQKIGPFDENFLIAFCEDGDYDLRMYKAGIRAYCIDLPYLHHGSMTVKNAEPGEVRKIQEQAAKNRLYFKNKWGFEMGSEEYYTALDKGGPPTPTP